jgi:Tol biopolymer transport system component/DNA-binding winged helix-turn-helix (wHTH) protein
MSDTKYRYYEFGEFRLDAYERQLLKDGEVVPLTFKVFEVLLVLVESRGRILEKEELMQRVWADAIVEESNLKNSISALRKALGDAPQVSRYIQTLPRRGYRLVADVVAMPDESDTLIIEKHTTAEIVIETLSDDEGTAANAHPVPVHADSSNAIGEWSTDTEALRPATDESAITTIAPESRVRQLRPNKASLINRLRRNKWAVGFGLGLVVIGVAALAIGLYVWISAGKAKPSLTFEKMKMTRLTNVGNRGAQISPDGKYLLYTMVGTSTDGLWIKQTATDSTIKLLPPVHIFATTFSKDSDYVYCAFSDNDPLSGALYKIPVFGGAPKLVLKDIAGGVSFSPDGRRMIFVRWSEDVNKKLLIAVNVDGSEERVILPINPRYSIRAYDWSPDGKIIALAIKNDTGEAPGTSQIITIPAEGGQERAITAPQKESITGINWLPDGSGFITVAEDQATGLPQLWHLSYPGGQAARITNDASHYANVSITADGGTMLARQVVVSQSLWIADSGDWNGSRKITTDTESYDDVSWTTDGRILYSEGGNVKSDLWIIHPDGTGRQRMTDDQSQNRHPVMSPDGRTIVYISGRSGTHQVWRMDSDGRNPRQLTNEPRDCLLPKITPDGQWVVYETSTAGNWTIRKIPIAGGESALLAEVGDKPVVSPDGKLLACMFSDEQKKRDVILINSMNGGEPVKVLDYPDFTIYRLQQWRDDGLYCLNNRSTQIALIPLGGKPPRLLTDFKTGERLYSFAWSPDGKQIALSRGVSKSETVMITDFKRP